MAFFGAPLEQADHAQKACAAALAMRDQLRALRLEWEAVDRPALKARTGINSGPMLVGNLGSRYRFAYGVLGDQVNLGSRLEGLNKIYGTDILIGENTANLVKDDFILRELDSVGWSADSSAERLLRHHDRTDLYLSRARSKSTWAMKSWLFSVHPSNRPTTRSAPAGPQSPCGSNARPFVPNGPRSAARF